MRYSIPTRVHVINTYCCCCVVLVLTLTRIIKSVVTGPYDSLRVSGDKATPAANNSCDMAWDMPWNMLLRELQKAPT